MSRHRRRCIRSRPPFARITLVALIAAVAASIGAGTAYADSNVAVMTYNVYQGTEFRHFAELQGTTPTFEQALLATTADYATYKQTRFKDRAAQIATTIASEKPALVGFQEIATWHIGAFNPSHPFALPEPVNEDFTQELLEALSARGQHYAVVSRRDGNFTLAFPILTPTFECCIAVGMVESGEIIARTDLAAGQFKVSNAKSAFFATNLPTIPNPLVPSEPFVFKNSWQSVDVKVPGKSFRFITTHLDALAPGGLISGPQAQELVAGPANTSLPVIVTGDMNSGPTSAPAAYNALLAGGLTDTWPALGLGNPPLTCCHLAPNDLVSDPNDTYTEDLDHILIRGSLTVKNEHLVGNTAPNPAPESFIWPSDHAGMVAMIATGG
jgi:endonuclease/exonuclease/phosphatase family metal-dependent hydrolase